jgi:hypothetical protein
MTAGPALEDDPQTAPGQVEIVMDHNQMFRGHMGISKPMANGLSAQVHIGLGKEQKDAFPLDLSLTIKTLEFFSGNRDQVPVGQGLED